MEVRSNVFSEPAPASFSKAAGFTKQIIVVIPIKREPARKVAELRNPRRNLSHPAATRIVAAVAVRF